MANPLPAKRESVSLWHPWSDKPGQRHTLSLWRDFSFDSIEHAVSVIGAGQYYALCNNIFKDVSPDLILNKSTEAYISRTGGIAALRVRSKRRSGFIIPGIHWGEQGSPNENTLETIQDTFNTFGYEALTPSSLSEKVLRSTLPKQTYISRPSVMVRNTFLASPSSARIQSLEGSHSFQRGYENDKIKAYCSIAAAGVPGPFNAPLRFYRSDIWQKFPVSWMKCGFTAHGSGLQPLQILDQNTGLQREPKEGESFEKWVWSGTLEDCQAAGYTCDVQEGYSWLELSTFMEVWADILFEKYAAATEPVQDIIKRMMVGLPGRFLRSPEVLTLIHLNELTPEDKQSLRAGERKILPIMAEWEPGESPISDWFMRVDSESEKARETAQLTPIGHFIVNECSRQIYHSAKREEGNGNRVIRIYVDSFTTTEQATTIDVGTQRGKYKVKIYNHVRIRHNQFYGVLEGTGKRILKAPGIGGSTEKERQEREKLIEELEQWTNPP